MPKPKVAQIHVNQSIIRANRKHGRNDPPVAVRIGRTVTYGYGADIKGPSRLVYNPDRPLKCGARLWIEASVEHVSVMTQIDVADCTC